MYLPPQSANTYWGPPQPHTIPALHLSLTSILTAHSPPTKPTMSSPQGLCTCCSHHW